MEERQDVSTAPDADYEPGHDGQDRLAPTKMALLGLALLLGATLTYLELYHRFSP
ncbi:MAG: hypothetical protein AAF678_11385 [Pseudomonadota bacterium]